MMRVVSLFEYNAGEENSLWQLTAIACLDFSEELANTEENEGKWGAPLFEWQQISLVPVLRETSCTWAEERENESRAFQHNSSSPHCGSCSWEHRLPLVTQLGQMLLVKGQWPLQAAKSDLSQLTWQSQGGFVGFSVRFCYWEGGM